MIDAIKTAFSLVVDLFALFGMVLKSTWDAFRGKPNDTFT